MTLLNKFSNSFGTACRCCRADWWNDVDSACASEFKIRGADGIPLSTTVLVSVGQATHQRINWFLSTKQFQWVSTERLRISSSWRWYLLQRIVQFLTYYVLPI